MNTLKIITNTLSGNTLLEQKIELDKEQKKDLRFNDFFKPNCEHILTLSLFEEVEWYNKWDSKYPKIYKSWHDNWATLSTYLKYPEAVRRLIYTTNAIEGFNRQLRKVTKSKTIFPSDDSLLKMLYLATMDITKKWTGRRQDWGQIHS